jgi:hypothetical protein
MTINLQEKKPLVIKTALVRSPMAYFPKEIVAVQKKGPTKIVNTSTTGI